VQPASPHHPIPPETKSMANDDGKDEGKEETKKPQSAPPRQTKKKRQKGPAAAVRLPTVGPTAKCKLRLSRMERVKDYLLLEQEFIQNQERSRLISHALCVLLCCSDQATYPFLTRLKPKEEKDQEQREKVEEIRGTPMAVGTLEEMIDDNHAIVSSRYGWWCVG
jgi:26S proteasome regulatory subunit T2